MQLRDYNKNSSKNTAIFFDNEDIKFVKNGHSFPNQQFCQTNKVNV